MTKDLRPRTEDYQANIINYFETMLSFP